MLRIDFTDIVRATLPIRSGNEGWIGVSPKGDQYHIVVPVDRQIARGVMACNRPTDGTPFGGYSGWLYFPCEPFEDEDRTGEAFQELWIAQARASADSLVTWLASYDIQAEVVGNWPISGQVTGELSGQSAQADRIANGHPPGEDRTGDASKPLVCDKCGKSWDKIGELLRDPGAEMAQYRACMDDFRQGLYIFAHSCGGSVSVPVTRLARPVHRGRFFGRQ